MSVLRPPSSVLCGPSSGSPRHWVAIPNFVDTERFRPVRDAGERDAVRRGFGVPADAFVVGSAVALKRHHKRVDCLVAEAGKEKSVGVSGCRGVGVEDREEEEVEQKAAKDAEAGKEKRVGVSGCRGVGVEDREEEEVEQSPKGAKEECAVGGLFLLVAGARTADTEALERMAGERLPGRSLLLSDVSRDRMPDFYRCLDVFVLPSLFEMMPIALLEALASGLPVIVNRHPVLEWMSGEGGVRIDMAAEGALAVELARMRDPSCRAPLGRAARERAERMFSKDAVVREMIRMYEQVLTELRNT